MHNRQTFCLKMVPQTTPFSHSLYNIYQTTLQCLSSYSCIITVLYIYMQIRQILRNFIAVSCKCQVAFVPCLTECLYHVCGTSVLCPERLCSVLGSVIVCDLHSLHTTICRSCETCVLTQSRGRYPKIPKLPIVVTK